MKIYVAMMDVLKITKKKGENKMKLSLPQKLTVFLFSPSPLNVNVLSCRFFKNLTWFMTKLRVLVLCFPYFMDFSIILKVFYKIKKKFERTFIIRFNYFYI